MTQNKTLTIRSFCHWDIGILVIVFPQGGILRISNFLTEKTEFSVKHYSAINSVTQKSWRLQKLVAYNLDPWSGVSS